MRLDAQRSVLVFAAVAALSVAGHALAQGDSGTSISGGPSGVTRDSTPTFSFSSSEPGVTFECRVDGAAQPSEWRACVSPLTLELADGDYVLSVRAVDRAGNIDPTPATRRFTVDTGLVDTLIDAGPHGLTNDPTPSFTFTSPVTGATFECRIDTPLAPVAAFHACSSPFTAPMLRSGDYVLRVRARAPDGTTDKTPATRLFTVDADPPETTITGGPSEGGQSGTRTPTFRFDSEPGATFQCRLDNRDADGVDTVAWAACPAGEFTAPELRGGRHVFEVRAKDTAGNVDPSPASRRFSISACEPVVRFGLVEAEAACLRTAGTEDAERWESKGPVTINGLRLPVTPGSKLVLEGPTPQRPGGTLSIEDLTLSVGGIELVRGSVRWTLPAGEVGGSGEITRFGLSKSGQKLFGLNIAGYASLSLARPSPDRYKAVLGLEVALPSIFRSAPAPPETADQPTPATGNQPQTDAARGSLLTGKVAIDIDKAGVHLNGAKIRVQDAYIGNLVVKDVCLSYVAANTTVVAPCEPPRFGGDNAPPFIECRSDSSRDRLDGAVALVLPTASQTELGAWAGLSGGSLSYAGAYVDNLGTLVPIAPGVFLQKVGIGLCVKPPPFQLKGQAKVGFGPPIGGRPAVALEGSFHYIDAHDNQPWSLATRGELLLFDRKVLEGYLTYRPTGFIDFGFEANLSFGPLTINGKVDGWIEQDQPDRGAATKRAMLAVAARRKEKPDNRDFPPPGSPGNAATKGRFNVDGRVRICLGAKACAHAEAVISSLGVAGCIPITTIPVPYPKWVGPGPFDWKIEVQKEPIQAGAGHTWGKVLPEPMAGSCSVGPWRIERAAARTTARAAQLGHGRSFEVPANQAAIAVRIHGAGAPPRIALRGPSGRRIASPEAPGGAFVPDEYLLAENPDDNTTLVMIAKPESGRWQVEALPDSAQIQAIDEASPRPEPIVAGRVVGRGHSRALHYVYAPEPGQRVTFVETGPRSQRTIGVASGRRCPPGVPRSAGGRELRCASLAFNPADGPRGRRTLLALVDQNGRPRSQLHIATYIAPPPLRANRPRNLRLRRLRGAVRVTWRRPRNAARTNILVRVADGRRRVYIRAPHVTALYIPAVRRRDTVWVSVRGMRLDGRQGRAIARRLGSRKTRSSR